MERNEIEVLINKYNEGLADPSEVTTLERLIEDGRVALTDLKDLALLETNLLAIKDPSPSMDLDDRFFQMLSQEKRKMESGAFSFQWSHIVRLAPRIAFASILLVVGFVGGYVFTRPHEQNEVASLTQEVSNLKEMVMLSLLEKESATDRLRAVNLTSEMDGVSKKVTKALIQTLNQDANVNVRLAALDALRSYVSDSQVREELIRSISMQSSPLVQVALSDLMVELQEKKSVKELEKLLKDKDTPKEVKERIQENIQTLI